MHFILALASLTLVHGAPSWSVTSKAAQPKGSFRSVDGSVTTQARPELLPYDPVASAGSTVLASDGAARFTGVCVVDVFGRSCFSSSLGARWRSALHRRAFAHLRFWLVAQSSRAAYSLPRVISEACRNRALQSLPLTPPPPPHPTPPRRDRALMPETQKAHR